MDLVQDDAFAIYGWLAFIYFAASFIGGFLGDHIWNYKKWLLAGVILQVIGVVLLLVNISYLAYLSVLLIGLGGGVYSTNLIAQIGKLRLDNKENLYETFNWVHLVTNLGVLIGSVLAGVVYSNMGSSPSFALICGIQLLSAFLIYNSKNVENPEPEAQKEGRFKVVGVLIFISVIVSCFWVVKGWSMAGVFHLQNSGSPVSFFEILPPFFDYSTASTVILVLAMMFIIPVITQRKFTKWGMLTGAFFMAATSIFLIWVVINNQNDISTVGLSASLLLIGIAEALINPVLHSFTIQFAHSKYLGSTISLLMIPSMILNKLASGSLLGFLEDPKTVVLICFLAMALLGGITMTVFNKGFYKE